MVELLVILAIYTALILFFVPLHQIAKLQTKLKNWVKKMIAKAQN